MPIDGDFAPLSDPLAPSPAPPLTPPPAAGRGARALALVGGIAALALVLTATFGTAVLALLGMAAAWGMAGHRGRPLTRAASWWGASLGVALGFIALTAFAIAKAPPGTMAEVRQTNDSLRAAAPPPEPPAWLRRIDPTGGRSTQLTDSTAEKLVRSPAFLVWVGAMSTALVAALLGGVVGTLGWGVGLLLAFGATGRWLPRGGGGGRATAAAA